MRQTYKRNQHGIHNKVLEGRMFRTMRDSREMSNRDLARELGLSEGMIRNAVAYADLVDMLGEDSNVVESMKVRDVKMAIRLGPFVAKCWINAGCKEDLLTRLFTWEEESGERVAAVVKKFELEPLFSNNKLNAAITMAREAAEALATYSDMPGAKAGMRSLIDRGESVALFLEHFLYGDDGMTPSFTQDEWDAIVQRAVDHEGDTAKAIAFQVRATCAANRAGVMDAKNPYHFGAIKRLEASPDFIRDAELFTLMERWYLADRYERALQSDFREYAEESMRGAVYGFQERRRMLLPTASEAEKRIVSTLPADTDSLIEEFAARLDRARNDAATGERNALFDDREKLTAMVIESVIAGNYRIRTGMIGNRPACEVFIETVKAWSMAELAMVAAVVMKDRYPFERWFNAAEECATVTQSDNGKRVDTDNESSGGEVQKKAGPRHRPTPSGRGRHKPTRSVSAQSDEKAELFPIERHEDGWVVVMPNGEITDPFLSKQAATQQAVRCRQIAKDDPEFLRIRTRKAEE
ncbi:MAG: hypothetical protein ACYC3X_21725 [Pirellulaceae bacterium]